MSKHKCNKQDIGQRHLGWSHCIVCEGREHEEGCTVKRNPKKDCCPARHKHLHDQGITRGITDSSFLMYNSDCVHLYGPLETVNFDGINPQSKEDYLEALQFNKED